MGDRGLTSASKQFSIKGKTTSPTLLAPTGALILIVVYYMYIRSASHFLRFQAFLPIYLVYLLCVYSLHLYLLAAYFLMQQINMKQRKMQRTEAQHARFSSVCKTPFLKLGNNFHILIEYFQLGPQS